MLVRVTRTKGRRLPAALGVVAAVVLATTVAGAAVQASPAQAQAQPAGQTVVSFAWGGGFRNQLGALPVFRRYGMHATFFVPSGLVCQPAADPGCMQLPYLTLGNIRQIAANGNEIGGLSVEHVPFNGLPAAEIQREICNDRLNLTRWGFQVSDFAYPFALASHAVQDLTRRCGYNSGLLYDASQGRNGGGNINAILKSGTNQFHGDVYEFFRNTVLDANEYFLNQTGSPRPVIQQNIFGGSLGGPVSPGGKLGFFFVNYQGTRQRSGDSPGTLISTFIPYVPAADRGTTPQAEANLAADFGVPRVDPVAASLLAFPSNQFGAPANGYLFPLPNVPAGTAPGSLVQFTVSKPGSFTDNQFTANWDKDFRNSRDRVSSRFFLSNSRAKHPLRSGWPAGFPRWRSKRYRSELPLPTAGK